MRAPQVLTTEVVYYRAETGEVVERIPMREFWGVCRVTGRYTMIRHYELAREAEFNPGFGKPPQGQNPFPPGDKGY